MWASYLFIAYINAVLETATLHMCSHVVRNYFSVLLFYKKAVVWYHPVHVMVFRNNFKISSQSSWVNSLHLA
jgi:hypothetical protein